MVPWWWWWWLASFKQIHRRSETEDVTFATALILSIRLVP